MSTSTDLAVEQTRDRQRPRLQVASLAMGLSRVVLLFVLVILGLLISEHFLNIFNVINMVRHAALLALISIGMTLSLLTAGIELSVGSVVALSSVVAAPLLLEERFIEGFLVALLVGLMCGLLNGGMIAYLRIPAFIATYAMMRVARGLALLYTGGKSVYDFAPAYRWIGNGFIWRIPVPVIIALILCVIMYFVLRYTTWGRRVYAVGANPIAARFSGFNVPLLLLTVYAVSGVLSGIAGLVYVAYVNAAEPVIGDQFALDAIAVVVIGGTPFSGGVGGIVQTAVGAVIIAVLNTILNLVNMSSYWQVFAKGAVILMALIFDLILRRYLGQRLK